MEQTKQNFYKLLIKFSLSLLLVILLSVGLLNFSYNHTPVSFNSDLAEIDLKENYYLYVSMHNPENGYYQSNLVDLNTGKVLLSGDLGYAGAFGTSYEINYLIHGWSEDSEKTLYEISKHDGLHKVPLSSKLVEKISGTTSSNGKYGVFMMITEEDSDSNYQAYLYDRITEKVSEINLASFVKQEYLQKRNEFGTPYYNLNIYGNDNNTKIKLEFHSDDDFRLGREASATYKFDLETAEIETIPTKSITDGNLHDDIVIITDSTFDQYGEIVTDIISTPGTLLFQFLGFIFPSPDEYFSLDEQTIYYNDGQTLPKGKYLRITDPVIGQQKLVLGDTSDTSNEQVLTSWFSTRYHYYTKFIPIPGEKNKVIVQINDKFGLLDTESKEFVLVTDLHSGYTRYRDFTDGKVMVEVL